MIAVVACGALSADINDLAAENHWPIAVHPLPPLLHNHPERIAGQVDRLITQLSASGTYDRIAVAYADCGTFGALDEVMARHGVARLGGDHCYDVYAGVERLRRVLADEPGTYLLTDYLALSFHRSVIVELGLDRHPHLRDDYFGHYRRVVWLAGRPTPDLHRAAERAAGAIGLPLEVIRVGLDGLRAGLARLVDTPRIADTDLEARADN